MKGARDKEPGARREKNGRRKARGVRRKPGARIRIKRKGYR